MATYGNGIYGISKYGGSPALSLSVTPMSTLVTGYNSCYVFWNIPSGSYTQIRLLRNQNSYSETEEDGIIIWQQITSNVTKNQFYDGGGVEDTSGVSLVSGKPVYYSMFLLTSDNFWVNAGTVTDIIPSNHGMLDIIPSILPRVFTSQEQSALAEIDTTSTLYTFFTQNGLVIEELMTAIDLILPDYSLKNTTASFLPLEVSNYGLTPEPSLPVKNQKQLVRDAVYMYQTKGTQLGLQTYIEDLTGYSPTISVSENLLLSPQDSTFYQSTGNWTATNATITASTEKTPPTGTNVIDTTYTCKIVASAAGSMTLGKDVPLLKGVPINSETDVTASVYVLSPSSAGNVSIGIQTYGSYGDLVGSEVTGTAVSATNTWKQATVTTTPSQYAADTITAASGDGTYITYTTSTVTGVLAGQSVTIQGLSISGFNLTNATIYDTPTSTTFRVANSTTGTSLTAGYFINSAVDADYAGITISWSAAGTYYVDMVCVQGGDTASYDEARAIDILLNPNKINLVVNPSFEVNVTDGWTLAGSATASQSTTVPANVFGEEYSAEIVGTGSWTFTCASQPVILNKYYTASVYLQPSASATLTIQTVNGSTVVDTSHITIPTSSSFSRYSVTMLVPASSTATDIRLQVSGSTGTYYLDATQLEPAFTYNPGTNTFGPTDYFDGDLPSNFGVQWVSTANDSVSIMYYSKDVKIARLTNTLSEWVPSNSFWRVRTLREVEYTNLMV